MAERKKFPNELSLELENYSTMFLAKGRKDWDIPHTRAVVYHAIEIAKNEGLDVLVQGTTGWLHDIGYYDLFVGDKSKEYDGVQDKKALHMIKGAEMAVEFFRNSDHRELYGFNRMRRVIHLVSVHDKLEELNALDEVAFMEADTLGAIDISRVQSTFDKESALKYIQKDLFPRRRARFRTQTGIATFDKLIHPYLAQYGLKIEDVTRT